MKSVELDTNDIIDGEIISVERGEVAARAHSDSRERQIKEQVGIHSEVNVLEQARAGGLVRLERAAPHGWSVLSRELLRQRAEIELTEGDGEALHALSVLEFTGANTARQRGSHPRVQRGEISDSACIALSPIGH
jgi:hypothetical protein